MFLIFLVSTPVLFAQSPDSWRGIQLAETTFEDAAAILGQPAKVKEKQKLRTEVGDWIDRDYRYKIAEFRDLEGAKKAKLYFREGKVRVIEIDLLEKVNPNALPSAYGIQFLPKVSGLSVAFEPEAYGRNDEGVTYPKKYPLVYSIIGVAESAFVVARVEQGTFSHVGKSLGGVQDDGLSFPGEAKFIQLVSRSLEDRSGLDALK